MRAQAGLYSLRHWVQLGIVTVVAKKQALRKRQGRLPMRAQAGLYSLRHWVQLGIVTVVAKKQALRKRQGRLPMRAWLVYRRYAIWQRSMSLSL